MIHTANNISRLTYITLTLAQNTLTICYLCVCVCVCVLSPEGRVRTGWTHRSSRERRCFTHSRWSCGGRGGPPPHNTHTTEGSHVHGNDTAWTATGERRHQETPRSSIYQTTSGHTAPCQKTATPHRPPLPVTISSTSRLHHTAGFFISCVLYFFCLCVAVFVCVSPLTPGPEMPPGGGACAAVVVATDRHERQRL